MKITILCLTCLIMGTAHAQEDAFVGVEKLMSDEEFTAAGLDQLSGQQLDALNNWLLKYTANEAPIISKSSKKVREKRINVINSEIVGDFNGWTGKTVVKLANGQTWRQRTSGVVPYSGPTPLKVEIKRSLGYYRLKMEGSRRTIGVERIE